MYYTKAQSVLRQRSNGAREGHGSGYNHPGACKYSDSRPGEYSNVRYDDTYNRRSAVKKFYHRRRVWRQRLLAACQTPPCEAASAASMDVHSLGCHGTVICCSCKNSKRLELDDPYSAFRFQACPGISSPDSRKAFRDLRVVRTPEVNLRYLRTGRIVCPIFPRDTATITCPPEDSFLTVAVA